MKACLSLSAGPVRRNVLVVVVAIVVAMKCLSVVAGIVENRWFAIREYELFVLQPNSTL